MSLHKQLIASLLTGILAAASTGVASANGDPQYPPMNGEQMGSVPPPPVYNAPYPQNVPPQYSRPAPRPYPQQMGGYGRPAPYGPPASNGGYGQRPGPNGPYGNNGGYNGSPVPYGNNGSNYGPRPGPWNNGGFNQGPFNQGPFNQMPWGGGNRGFGNNNPFNKMFNSRYGGIWGMRPDEWAKAGPEDGFSYMWDDMINAPSEMGEMPGGWNAPSISVPNPVEIGSEFRKEAPNLAREIPNMINVN